MIFSGHTSDIRELVGDRDEVVLVYLLMSPTFLTNFKLTKGAVNSTLAREHPIIPLFVEISPTFLMYEMTAIETMTSSMFENENLRKLMFVTNFTLATNEPTKRKRKSANAIEYFGENKPATEKNSQKKKKLGNENSRHLADQKPDA